MSSAAKWNPFVSPEGRGDCDNDNGRGIPVLGEGCWYPIACDAVADTDADADAKAAAEPGADDRSAAGTSKDLSPVLLLRRFAELCMACCIIGRGVVATDATGDPFGVFLGVFLADGRLEVGDGPPRGVAGTGAAQSIEVEGVGRPGFKRLIFLALS